MTVRPREARPHKSEEETMTPSEMTALIHRWVAEVWNGGNLDRIPDYMASEYVLHVQNGPEEVRGPDGFSAFCREIRATLPDLNVTIGDVLVQSDKCAWRFWITGTQRGPLNGIPASGKPVAFGGIVMSRFADDRWVEDWVCWDVFGILQQIGAVPSLQATPAAS
jgi:steroid delta-isomerase-like uncharacterized protein